MISVAVPGCGSTPIGEGGFSDVRPEQKSRNHPKVDLR